MAKSKELANSIQDRKEIFKNAPTLDKNKIHQQTADTYDWTQMKTAQVVTAPLRLWRGTWEYKQLCF